MLPSGGEDLACACFTNWPLALSQLASSRQHQMTTSSFMGMGSDPSFQWGCGQALI